MTASALVLLVSLSAPPAPAAAEPLDERTVLAWVADLTAENFEKRMTACLAFEKAGPRAKAAVPALIKMINPKTGEGFIAIDMLAHIGPAAKEAVPTLMGLLARDTSSGYYVEGIARALAKIDGPKIEATRALLLSSGKCTPIYLTVSSTLYDYPGPVVGHLVTLCADKDAKVREQAATVIATLNDLPRIPFATLYMQAGGAARGIPPALEKLLADDVAEVRVAAAKAVPRVAPELADKAVTAIVAFAIERANANKGELPHGSEAFKAVPEKAAKALIPLLGHDNETLRYWAINHLSDLPVRDAVEDALKNGKTVRIRQAAAITLGARYGKDSIPALKAALKDSEFTVRFAAAEALVNVGTGGDEAHAAAVPMFAEALQHKDEQVRIVASRDLPRLGPPAKAALPALKKLLDDEKPEVRLEAAITLVALDGAEAKGAVPALIAGLKMGDAAATRAAKALGELGPAAKDAVPELVKHFDAKNPHLRLHTAGAAGRIDPAQAPKAAEVLVALLKDKKYRVSMVRSYSLVALSRIGPAAKDALPALAEILKDDGPFHADVARTMIAIDPDGAEPAYEWVRAVLTGKSDDDDAYDLLERLPEFGAKAKPLVPELVKLLQSKTAFYRENAVLTLAAIGPDAKDALPELKKLAEGDKKDDIRKLAADAVKKIEGK
jgi:HEAT repeat protein